MYSNSNPSIIKRVWTLKCKIITVYDKASAQDSQFTKCIQIKVIPLKKEVTDGVHSSIQRKETSQ